MVNQILVSFALSEWVLRIRSQLALWSRYRSRCSAGLIKMPKSDRTYGKVLAAYYGLQINRIPGSGDSVK